MSTLIEETPAQQATASHGEGSVSVEDGSFDTMIEAASVPNLASLFRKAKKSGAIGSVSVYGEA